MDESMGTEHVKASAVPDRRINIQRIRSSFRGTFPALRAHTDRGVPPGRSIVPSGRERFGIGFLLVEEGHCLEPVVAGQAMPEIGGAARTVLDPFGDGDRPAALGAGIFMGLTAEIDSGHGAFSLFAFL
jgi:hypothetical protein